MKTKLLFFVFLILSIELYSQNVWTGNINDLWSNPDNWTGNVPDASDDVLIPTGFAVTVDTPADIRSIEVQGNSTLNVTESITIAVDSEFEDNVVVNWSSGDLIGPGVLLNNGTINISFSGFDLSGSVVLNNPGEINLSGGGNIFIGTDSVLNNSGTGIIDFQTTGSEISNVGLPPNTLNNQGVIKTSMPNPTDIAAIDGYLINSSGIFQVDSGALNINTVSANFMGGQFNIASGASMNWNETIDATGILTGNVLGELNWNNDLNITTTVEFNFTGNAIINNTGGDLTGGGTLTNTTTLALESGNLAIEDASTLNNNGAITLQNSSDILIDSNGTLNNNLVGAISIEDSGCNIGSQGIADTSRLFNNLGTLNVTLPSQSDQSSVTINLNNDGGTLNVNNGVFNLNFDGLVLNGGAYNITSTAVLAWAFPVSISGDLTGNLEGNILWGDDINVNTSATFDFNGSGTISWNSGNIEGGGTLTNENVIVKTSGGTKRINGGTTLNNNGELRQIVGGTISVSTGSVLNNNSGGVIDLQASTSGFSNFGVAPNVINNSGNILSNTSSGSAFISAQVTNTGTIEITQNALVFNGSGALTNSSSGIIKGVGTLTLPSSPSDFINNGIFSPGLSPGTLSLVNEFNSSPTSIIEIDINGSVQGVDYDLLTIDGDANLDGGINVSLGFAPSISDEFVILNTPGSGDTIDLCNLPSSTTASFGGFTYEFTIACRNSDELVLSVTDQTLSDNSNEVLEAKIFPNPTTGQLTINDETINHVWVYDINGREVFTSNDFQFSIASLKDGLYFIKAQNKMGYSFVQKVIKK